MATYFERLATFSKTPHIIVESLGMNVSTLTLARNGFIFDERYVIRCHECGGTGPHMETCSYFLKERLEREEKDRARQAEREAKEQERLDRIKEENENRQRHYENLVSIRNQLSVDTRNMREMRECTVCAENPIRTVFLPCGHFVTCQHCADKLAKCPICRTTIKGSAFVLSHTF